MVAAVTTKVFAVRSLRTLPRELGVPVNVAVDSAIMLRMDATAANSPVSSAVVASERRTDSIDDKAVKSISTSRPG